MAFTGYDASFPHSEMTQRILNYLPSWMEMRKNPNSVGQQFMNAAAGLEFEEIEQLLTDLLNNSNLGTADVEQTSWIYKILYDTEINENSSPTIIGQREGDGGIPTEYNIIEAKSLREFYNASPTSDIGIIDYDRKTLYVRRPYNYVKINDELINNVSLHHVWNSFDEIGLRIGLMRFWGESNLDFKSRIINAIRYQGDATRSGMTRWIAGQLGLVKEIQWISTDSTLTIPNAIVDTIKVGNEFVLEGQYALEDNNVVVYPRVPIYPRDEFITLENLTAKNGLLQLNSTSLVGTIKTPVIFPRAMDYWGDLVLEFNLPEGTHIQCLVKDIYNDVLNSFQVVDTTINISTNPYTQETLNYPIVLEFTISRPDLSTDSPTIGSMAVTYVHKNNTVTYVSSEDISLDVLFDENFKAQQFTAEGLPTPEMKQWVQELIDIAPIMWDRFKWDEAYWDVINDKLMGIDVLPNRLDAPLTYPEKYLQVGIGDKNDLKVKMASDGTWRFDIQSGYYYIGYPLTETFLYANPVTVQEPGPTSHVIINDFPKFGAPIRIKAGDITLTQVSFLDDNLSLVIANKETHTLNGDTIYVNYRDLDIDTVEVRRLSDEQLLEVDTAGYDNTNAITLTQSYTNTKVEVTYKVKNSFYVEIGTDSITIHMSDIYTDIEVTYEGGENIYYTSSLEINPCKNHIPMGFLYITNTIRPIHQLLISASPDYLIGDERDRSIIVVDVVDEYENPIFDADVSTELSGMTIPGTLVKTASYMNRHVYIYTAPDDTGTQTLTFSAGGKSGSVDIKVG